MNGPKERTRQRARRTIYEEERSRGRASETAGLVGRGRQRRRARRKARPKRSRSASLLAAALLVCAIFSALLAADGIGIAGKIRGGVSVGDVALGGKTREEAGAALSSRSPGTPGEVRISGPRSNLSVPAEDLGVRLDAAATAKRAYAVGRRGGFFERLSDRLAAPFGVEVSAEVRYGRGAARAEVARLADRVNRTPRDASVEITGTEVRVSPSSEGYRLDEAATAVGLGRALEDLSADAKASGRTLDPEVNTAEARAAAGRAREAVSGPLGLSADGDSWTIPADEVGSALGVFPRNGTLRVGLDRDALRDSMAPVYADLTVEPVEADYDVVGGGATPEVSVIPGREGRRIEEDKLLKDIEGGIFEGRREYEVPVTVATPRLTTAEARRMKPTEMLGSYRTDYSMVPDDGTRVENLDISSASVNGTILAPGQRFSMLDHVAGLDYNDSKVIVGGEEVNADGGGLCQVTSTLYNAVNFAGLDVVERTPHSSQLPYIRPGMDATVWWGGPGASDDLDMKFVNTSGGYLLLREYVAGDGHVYAEVWGRPNGTDVTMRSRPVYMDGNGSEWVTRQTVEKDGKVVYDGQLHRDTYEPLTDIHGTAIAPADVPVAPVNP